MSTLTEFYGGGGDTTNTYIELQGGSPGGGITFTEPSATATGATSWGGPLPGLTGAYSLGTLAWSSGIIGSNSSDSAYWGIVSGNYSSGSAGTAGYVTTWAYPGQEIPTVSSPYSCSAGGFTVATGSKIEWNAVPSGAVTMSGPELKTFSNITWRGFNPGTSFTLNLPKLETFDRMCFGLTTTFNCNSSPNLANVTNMRVISGGTNGVINIQNAALSYNSVSNILKTIATTSTGITLTGLVINLQGGTSAGTSSLNATDIANLSACLARGITIQLN